MTVDHEPTEPQDILAYLTAGIAVALSLFALELMTALVAGMVIAVIYDLQS